MTRHASRLFGSSHMAEILICMFLLLAQSAAKPRTTHAKSSTLDIPSSEAERIKRQSGNRVTSDDIASAQLQPLFGRLVQHIEMDVDNQLLLAGGDNFNATDDSPATEQNTLDGTIDMHEQHEPSSWLETNDTADNHGDAHIWNRIKKQGIPVLEPVKHLLNTVRDHHHLVANHTGGHGVHHTNHTESPAIETEEDRETAIDSQQFDFLETLGTIAAMVWNVLSNLQKVFAASSGTASAASSSSSSGRR